MKKIILIFIFAIGFISCTKDDDSKNISNCDSSSEVIADNIFNNINTSNYSISNVILNGDCLEITIGSSGCNANLWEMELYSTNAFYTVYPLQRAVKLKLTNNQACLAFFQKTKSFDLTPFRMEGQNSLPLNIVGWDKQIIYKY
jgi:hypothetical protein